MIKKLTCLAMCVLSSLSMSACTAAHAADDQGVEWRLLGPAFAHHARNSGGDVPIKTPAYGVFDCKYDYGYNCYGRIVPMEQGWSNTNPAIGIERSAPSFEGATTRDRVFAMVVRDSYGKMGLMAGVGRAWPVASLGTLNLEAGIAGGLWYRTVSGGVAAGGKINFCHNNDPSFGSSCIPSDSIDYRVTFLKRRFIPFILPMLSMTERTTGLGLNIGLAPKIKIGRYESVPTTTLMTQITYKLNF